MFLLLLLLLLFESQVVLAAYLNDVSKDLILHLNDKCSSVINRSGCKTRNSNVFVEFLEKGGRRRKTTR